INDSVTGAPAQTLNFRNARFALSQKCAPEDDYSCMSRVCMATERTLGMVRNLISHQAAIQAWLTTVLPHATSDKTEA
ncbi:hypothetical protein LTR56_016468, partial [Elasticomyces elasticus]